ncbi:hypothetical protein [Sodalis glossinidius]|uniref:hypothetical protein n=1 Tax=Sodalis glossinidius TaxID=63612 RepID=UPI0011D0C213|nr:hypothetical protein [Sodalis glossinidius]
MSTTFEGGKGVVCSKSRSRQGFRGSCPAHEPAREGAFPDDFIDSSVVSGGGLIVSKRGLVVSRFSTMSLYIMKIVILKQLKLPKQPSFAYITKKVAVAYLVFVYLSHPTEPSLRFKRAD